MSTSCLPPVRPQAHTCCSQHISPTHVNVCVPRARSLARPCAHRQPQEGPQVTPAYTHSATAAPGGSGLTWSFPECQVCAPGRIQGSLGKHGHPQNAIVLGQHRQGLGTASATCPEATSCFHTAVCTHRHGACWEAQGCPATLPLCTGPRSAGVQGGG